MFRLFRRSDRERAVDELYATVVRQARQPHFYAAWGVPDTVEGRFEMIAVHAFLLLRRLKRERAQTAKLAQAFFDLMFADLDRNLREMGIGDMGVGKRVKAMAQSFYGRIAAYEAGLAGGDAALAEALLRNVFRGETAIGQPLDLAGYVRRQADHLDGLDSANLLAGRLSFAAMEAVS
jgi:cytochrome b pre-mRNA-processing protein 3